MYKPRPRFRDDGRRILQSRCDDTVCHGNGAKKAFFEPYSLVLTISVLIKETEGLLEFSNLFFGQLVSHGESLNRSGTKVFCVSMVSTAACEDQGTAHRDPVPSRKILP